MKVKDIKTGDIHTVRKYIIDDEGVESIWCDSWYGRHAIGFDCEWANQSEDSEAVELKPSVQRLVEEFRKDNSEGSYYYAWQANIAMAFFDQFLNDHEGVLTQRQLSEVANKAAKRFLDQLIHTP